jgi:transcriptional activator of comK gene
LSSFRSQWPLKVVVFVLSLTIMFILLWQVYKVMPDMNAADSSPVVGIITSDAITDQSWGSLAYEGKLRIMQKYDVSVIFASEKYNVQDMKRTIKDMIADGAELIIGHGRGGCAGVLEFCGENKKLK